MKTTIVPAQVTTVEDRITGKLSVSQIMLFSLPVFGGSLLYTALPPSMESSLYKVVIIGILTVLAGLLAIRIKGKIVLAWLVILFRYLARPRLYVFNKNTSSYREPYYEPFIETAIPSAHTTDTSLVIPKLDTLTEAHVYATLDDPMSRIQFATNKKGSLYARITKGQ